MRFNVLCPLIIISTGFFWANVVLSAIAGATKGIIFKNSIGEVSHRHNTFVTPIGWTFMIWNFIFLTVGTALIFLTANLCRSNRHGLGKMYCNPGIFSTGAAVAFILNQIFYTTWLFVWDNETMTQAAVILFWIALTNWLTLILISRNLLQATDYLSCNSAKDLWLYRVLVQNSLGMYTTWTTIATLLNGTIALVYDAGMNSKDASLICLSVLTILIVLWIGLELFLWDRHFRYMITPLLTVIWALTGIQVRLQKLAGGESQSEDAIPVMHFVTALLAFVTLFTFVRLSLLVYRHFKQPLEE